MSFLMTLTAAERDVILALRQKSGKHTFFNEDGTEVVAPAPKKRAPAKKKVEAAVEAALPAPPPCPPGAMLCATPAGESSAAAPEPAAPKKRVLTEEQKAKMKAGREAARAKKLEKELAERQALRDLEEHVPPSTYLAMLAEAPLPSPAVVQAVAKKERFNWAKLVGSLKLHAGHQLIFRPAGAFFKDKHDPILCELRFEGEKPIVYHPFSTDAINSGEPTAVGSMIKEKMGAPGGKGKSCRGHPECVGPKEFFIQHGDKEFCLHDEIWGTLEWNGAAFVARK